jgi:hypothetical protein
MKRRQLCRNPLFKVRTVVDYSDPDQGDRRLELKFLYIQNTGTFTHIETDRKDYYR